MLAAIIAHADDSALLRRCIEHHLAVGFDHVFVSLNTPDPAQDADHRERWASDPRVRIEDVTEFAPDPFHFFTAAKDVVMSWVEPAWIAFIDSDEFWVPRSGHMEQTAHLDTADMLQVARHNAPAVRQPGRLTAELPDEVRGLPVFAATEPPYPKILVRPEVVGEVVRGAHNCSTTRSIAPEIRPRDLVIVHLPFTTRARFRDKIVKVRRRLHDYEDRFHPSEATHWRRWLELEDAGGLDDEFDAQVFSPAQVAHGLSTGLLVTVPSLLVA